MTLPLTPATLEAAYDFLRAMPPFSRWGLPPGDEIRFRVTSDPEAMGWHSVDKDGHCIDISGEKVGHLVTLMKTMAHEMIHLRQDELGLKRTHGKGFAALAHQVSKVHGFDPKEL
ncbi:MAG: hypothetical protein A3E78_12080 [Alphaproteobacteria bacterium RIFCSPHIGHO2_12_FULL_63_12]|nr:MAG: hypothetical protein A3E78_12080 [Alphaproteobacteria bacterium RIFCSPHIGHO2_12_FULL_63_12]